MRIRVQLLLGVTLVGLLGCGGASPQASKPQFGEANTRGDAAKERLQDGAPQAPPGGGKGGERKPAAEPETISRRVIYSATVEVQVKNVDQVRAEVDKLTETHKGYIAKSDVSGLAGTRRTATWTLKIPSGSFRVVIAGLTELGTVTKNASDSQDVTEEFIDLEGRIKNLKVEEETLNKFLKETVNNVDGYIKTRDQIKSVRLDIERAEGRLKYLSTMTTLSTIQFTAREESTYSPDTPLAAPTFGDRVGNTLGGSWGGLVSFGEGVVIVLVAVLPWSPFIILGVVVGWVIWKRSSARTRAALEARRKTRSATEAG